MEAQYSILWLRAKTSQANLSLASVLSLTGYMTLANDLTFLNLSVSSIKQR